jgi:tetratricopeptide (TPR) repeat protein
MSITGMMLILVALGGLSACVNLPQIIVLHDPLTPAEHVTLGTSYEGEGRPELAAREYQAALARSQGYAPAFIGLGNLAFERGKLEEAETYYGQALAIVPDNPGAKNNLAMLYLARGDSLAEAERLARDALPQSGQLRPYVLDTLAQIYKKQGSYAEALDALAQAEAAAPTGNGPLQAQLAQSRREVMALLSSHETK